MSLDANTDNLFSSLTTVMNATKPETPRIEVNFNTTISNILAEEENLFSEFEDMWEGQTEEEWEIDWEDIDWDDFDWDDFHVKDMSEQQARDMAHLCISYVCLVTLITDLFFVALMAGIELLFVGRAKSAQKKLE